MRLIITRHGETKGNKDGVVQGIIPGKLSRKGILQAKKLALRLKDEGISIIFSSDLKRAKDTTNVISNFYPTVPVNFIKDLRERDLGEWEGKKVDDLTKHSVHTNTIWIDPQQGETLEALYIRAEDFLNYLLLSHSQKTVLCVGHNGINKALIVAITTKFHEDIRTIENHNNTSITIFDIDKKGNYTTEIYNCTKHLD